MVVVYRPEHMDGTKNSASRADAELKQREAKADGRRDCERVWLGKAENKPEETCCGGGRFEGTSRPSERNRSYIQVDRSGTKKGSAAGELRSFNTSTQA